MKTILLYFITIFSTTTFVKSQVGINTNTPTRTLDINGDINIRKELRLGGNDNTLGS